MVELTDQQRADAEYVEGLYRAGERLRLDFSDERQYRHAVDVHNLVGQTAEKYPGLHRGLAEARDDHVAAGGPPPLDAADAAGFETSGIVNSASKLYGTPYASAQAAATILGGAPMLANALYVKDTNQNPLAVGGDSQYGDGSFLEVQTEAQGAQPLVGAANAVLMYTYQPAAGKKLISEYATRAVAGIDLRDPTVLAPVQVKTTGKRIRIALDRGPAPNENQDVDYWFGKGTSNLVYTVPLVGSALFAATVQTVEVEGALIRGTTAPEPNPGPKGGLIELSPAQAKQIASECIKNGSLLEWNFPVLKPVIFANAKWSTTDSVYMTMRFTVNLVGQLKPVVVAVVCAEGADNAEDGTAFIKPLEFVFHCLAEGTRIGLADGSTEAIEALTKKNVLKGMDGVDPGLVSTVLGEHDGTVLRLTVDAERQLVLSHDHLVLTPSGPRPAGELAAGDEVLVEDGVAALAAVAEEQFQGLLCNASLSLPEEQADPSRNSMLANGIRVGDYELQRQFGRARREDPEWVLAHLDEIFHEDYRNHLAAKAAA